MEAKVGGVSAPAAVIACTWMTLFYVAILYAPTFVLRLPPPYSFKEHMIRRFVCATVSSVVSVIVCAALLFPIQSWDFSTLLGVFGIRGDHIWQAVIFPLSLTSLIYAGSVTSKLLLWVESRKEAASFCSGFSFSFSDALNASVEWILSRAHNILFWRNLVVAPLTEELVFRACMIPLLLCGGFKNYSIIVIFPVLFSLAHLNHFMEVYFQQNRNFLKASIIIGLQLSYTVVFGSYASFLLIRTAETVIGSNGHIPFIGKKEAATYGGVCLGVVVCSNIFFYEVSLTLMTHTNAGHLLSPLVAHIFCNYMGLPKLHFRRKGGVSLAFAAGTIGFLWLLFPLTRPELYNDSTYNCRCWQGYCSWN